MFAESFTLSRCVRPYRSLARLLVARVENQMKVGQISLCLKLTLCSHIAVAAVFIFLRFVWLGRKRFFDVVATNEKKKTSLYDENLVSIQLFATFEQYYILSRTFAMST